VGASSDRNKFGNKVLRCYLQNNKKCVPINKRSLEIEGVACVSALSDLLASSDLPPEKIGVSIITPPGVTRLILQEAFDLGIRQFFLQPGTVDKEVNDFVRDAMPGANVVKRCVLVDLGFQGEEGEAW